MQFSRPLPWPVSAITLASLVLLSACSGGDAADTPAAASPSGAGTANTLSGTVAVGAPITNGTLRVLDASGAVVASDVAIDADGHYADITLTGPAPYRIEACGHAGPNYQCVYSVATSAGTANVTPLTTATVLLAAGQAPDALMSGSAPGLTASSVSAAQEQLRSGLSGVLASAGVSNTIDFVSSPLTAGSRTGYDGVLDAVGVSVGQDAHAFVQITPRIGAGNLYLEQGTTSGTVTTTSSAAALQLSGLETLFRNLSDAMASATACSSETTGARRSMASSAHMSMGGDTRLDGPDQVAQGLCSFFAQGDDGSTPMWGARLLSPTLGRCDLSGSVPVCAVSFVLQSAQGDVMPVGNGMAVTQEGGAWKFVGDLLPIEVHASAKAQRTLRIDSATPVYNHDRALAFEVAAVAGLQCARVSQRDAGGSLVPVGYYKRHAGAVEQQRLSLWTLDSMGNQPSLEPLAGATRSADDTWIPLPEGDAGDAVIRNFYRGGRSVTVSLYADAACSTPFAIGGKSEFEVDVDGVPPVWSAMSTLPWPALSEATAASLRTLTLDAGASGSFSAAWTFARGPLGMNGITVCSSRAECGQGGSGRIGEASLRPSVRSASVTLQNNGSAITADSAKLVALYGRNGEGLDLQSNYASCPLVASGEACH